MKQNFSPVLQATNRLLQKGANNNIMAIDGRCGSGKTSLAEFICQSLPQTVCRVIHMDDFYLPVQQRPSDWQQRPAGNLDLPRLEAEVMQPAQIGAPVSYRPYNCQAAAFSQPRQLPAARLTIIEGSYSLHPILTGYYQLKVFLTISPSEQAKRLQAREGENYAGFVKLWIPLEEKYLESCAIEAAADLVINTSNFPSPAY